MSFSRYKALLKFTRIPAINSEYKHDISSRLYCRKVVFSSSSPNEIRIKPKKQSVENERNHDENKKFKRNFRLQDNPKYQKCLEHEDVHENVELSHDSDLDQRILSNLSKEEKSYRELLLKGELNRIQIDQINNDIGKKDSNTSSINQTPNFEAEWNEENKIFTRSKLIDTPNGKITYDLSADEFDLSKFVKEFNKKMPKALDECNEDLSYFGTGLQPTYNFAAYANNSRLIQEYVKLGVKLYKAEKNPDHMRALLSVDLEKELPIYIQFLHDCGVPADNLGDVITECPMILKEDLDDMKTRIRYLRAHDFSKASIARIVTKNPFWLTWATKHIDERLGHFQNEFKLQGEEVRFLATRQPQLITYNFKHIHENTFAVREEMGFEKNEIKIILLSKPKIWMMARSKIVKAFDYLHNAMKLSHLVIASQPGLLTCRQNRIQNRHEFLVELKKAQFDPKQPGYISPFSMVMGSDVEFCNDIAKVAIETYNLFLKTR